MKLKSANSVKLILFFFASSVLLLTGCAAQKQPDIYDPGSRAWMERIDLIAGLHSTTGGEADIGSQQWMQVMSEKFGVYDDQGHGPDLDSYEWRDAMHRKIFGSPQDIIVRTTYNLNTGEQLTILHNKIRNTITFTYAGRDITLPHSISASGARFSIDDEEVLWIKGADITYWKDGEKIFDGIEKIK